MRCMDVNSMGGDLVLHLVQVCTVAIGPTRCYDDFSSLLPPAYQVNTFQGS
jgi:hypothetical protein